MSNYTFKRIEKSLYQDIRTLYVRSFNSKRSMDYMFKKYNTDFFGLRDIGFLAYDENGTPAGYYGVFPIIMSIKGKDVLVAQSGDTMTDPDHRKKGLFTQLALKTYELAKNEGVKFIFGFPNQNSLPGFERKLNWEFYGNMQEFKIKTKAIPIAEISAKSLFLRKIHKKYCKTILGSKIIKTDNPEIQNFVFDDNDYFIKKDNNFFNYKQFSTTFLVQ
ncbi:MAG: GNAT family N-acetyltransferase, partial [Saprospiraceae bacterium]|nr:GNAT family N-acetyltransferase [Saprospiraceae bacterium]